jgi:hypothetical protein
VVFLAELHGEPRPSDELPALVWLTPETLCEAAQADLPFARVADGAVYLSPQARPPASALARLTDSPDALTLALGADALAFYRNLLNRSA